MKKLLLLLFSAFFLISLSVFAKDISDCRIIGDDNERLECYDSLSDGKTAKTNQSQELKDEGIFFQVVSKEKYEDGDGDETCLTDFVVTNNTIYTLKLDDYHDGQALFDNVAYRYESYKAHFALFGLVNPNLEKTEVYSDDDYIEYFEPGMTANLQDTYQTMGPEYELSKMVAQKTKCKRIKKYVFYVECRFELLDSNKDEIEWKSRKEEYTTILKLHKPHPDHDKKEFGKIQFKKQAC